MSWGNFSNDTDQNNEQNPDQVNQEQAEPKKLIQSVELLDTLSDRTNELTSKLLSDIDKDTGLAKQLINLNITNVNKATSKETNYKTEEDRLDAYSNDILNHENNDLFRSITNYSVSSERKKRYDIYEQILDSNYIAFRILKSYLNNTLIKNAQTKNFLTIKTPDEKDELMSYLGREIKNSYDKFTKSIMIKYKFQRKLKDVIVPKALLLGNYFVEIVDLNKLDTIATHEQIIMESTRADVKPTTITPGHIFESNFDCFNSKEELFEAIAINTSSKEINESAYTQNYKRYLVELQEASLTPSSIEEKTKILLESEDLTALKEFRASLPIEPKNPNGIDSFLNDSILESDTDYFDLTFMKELGIKVKSDKKSYNLDDISKLNFNCLKDIFINYIHPRNVIIIEKDGLVYGYLIVEDMQSGSGGEYVVDRFKRMSTGISSTNGEGTAKEENVAEITEKLTDEIIKKVIHNIKLTKSRGYSSEYDYFKTLDLGDEATSSLKLLIYSKVKQKSKLKFRFLTPESLVNFNTGIDKFAPYGTSVFDPLVGPVKLYTLALMSSVVSRLSRAAVIRKWTIEAGEKRNHKEIIQKTQAELKSKAITYDKINTLKNISEIVTDFRDMATITINGQRYIDMEIMPMQDRGLPLNDLNDLKMDIVAAGGVPPIYLNMGDTTDLRESLVHLNVTFANDIIDKQQSLEDGINTLNSLLFKKVLVYNDFEDADFDLSNYTEIKLNPPLVLQIQSDEAMITTVTNIINLLEQTKMSTNPKSLFKKYIPSINWDILEKEGNDYKRELGKKAIAAGDTGSY